MVMGIDLSWLIIWEEFTMVMSCYTRSPNLGLERKERALLRGVVGTPSVSGAVIVPPSAPNVTTVTLTGVAGTGAVTPVFFSSGLSFTYDSTNVTLDTTNETFDEG